MSYNIEALKRIRYYIEPNGLYAIDNQTNVASAFKDIKVSEATMEIIGEQLDNATMNQRIDRFSPKINSRRRCNLSLTTYLNGTGVSASLDVQATVNPIIELLYTTMGYGITSVGSTLVNTPGSRFYDIGSISASVEGCAIGMINPTTNRLECIRIVGTGSNASQLTSSVGFSFTPTTGSTVYGSATCYLKNDPDSSLQFYVEGDQDDDKWVLMGLQGGFSIKTELGQLPTVTFKLENGAYWTSGSATSGLTEADYTDALPIPFVDSLIYFNPMNKDFTTTNQMTPIDCFSFEITPNISYIDILSERGIGNILRKRRNRNVPVLSGKFVTYYDDKTYWQIKDNVGTSSANSYHGIRFVDIGFQVGGDPGNTVFISMPQCQITNVQRVDAGGIAGIEVSFDAHEVDYVTTDPVANINYYDLAKSAFSIHFV